MSALQQALAGAQPCSKTGSVRGHEEGAGGEVILEDRQALCGGDQRVGRGDRAPLER